MSTLHANGDSHDRPPAEDLRSQMGQGCGVSREGRACSVGGCPLCGPWGLVLMLVLVGLFLGGELWGRLRSIKGTEPYRLAMERLASTAEARAALGDGIQDVTWFPGGRVFEDGDRGEAQFVLKVAGSRGAGELFVQARRLAGAWSLTDLQLRLSDGTSLNLLSVSPAEAAPGAAVPNSGRKTAGGEAPRWTPPGGPSS
ncbi:MAG: cytochrome c oxidase assembly factor 1 family protein [Thermoguttaceae bacterium]|nr:cytochrome c oxidase assembly factor 1 family protein [Thermoguttaceae bacterium]MDW8078061.1 cytochrome c oxidase assembly factor Coa1 family protein [Thermoguttaceae bacterium]